MLHIGTDHNDQTDQTDPADPTDPADRTVGLIRLSALCQLHWVSVSVRDSPCQSVIVRVKNKYPRQDCNFLKNR